MIVLNQQVEQEVIKISIIEILKKQTILSEVKLKQMETQFTKSTTEKLRKTRQIKRNENKAKRI